MGLEADVLYAEMAMFWNAEEYSACARMELPVSQADEDVSFRF